MILMQIVGKGSANLVLGQPQGMVGLGSRWRDLAYASEGSYMPGTYTRGLTFYMWLPLYM